MLIAEQLFALLDVKSVPGYGSVADHRDWTEVTITDGASYLNNCARFILGANNAVQQKI